MTTLEKLKELHEKFCKKFSNNPNTGQMCCMWSISNPPDEIYDSAQIYSIEETFDIQLTEDEAYFLYDQDLTEASETIEEYQVKHAAQNHFK